MLKNIELHQHNKKHIAAALITLNQNNKLALLNSIRK